MPQKLGGLTSFLFQLLMAARFIQEITVFDAETCKSIATKKGLQYL